MSSAKSSGIPKNPDSDLPSNGRDGVTSGSWRGSSLHDESCSPILNTQEALDFLYDPKLGYEASRLAASQRMARSKQMDTDEDIDLVNVQDEEVPETPWTDIARHQDRHLALKVALTDLAGTSVRAKKQELLSIAQQRSVNITAMPTSYRVGGVDYFRFTPVTEEGVSTLLSMEVCDEASLELDLTLDGTMTPGSDSQDTASPARRPMFTLVKTADDKDLIQRRTVVLYGLCPRVDLKLVPLAMAKYGPVEKVTTSPCSYGYKLAATVVFRDVAAVKAMQDQDVKFCIVGRDLVRVHTRGLIKVDWEVNHKAKLVGLPFGTTAVDLLPLLASTKAWFLFVQKVYGEGKFNKGRYLREATFFFPSAEAKAAALAVRPRLGATPLMWAGQDEKLCYECQSPDHVRWKCPVAKQQQEIRAHKARVQQLAKTGHMQVTSNKSFAQVASGKAAHAPTGPIPKPSAPAPVPASVPSKPHVAPMPAPTRKEATLEHARIDSMEKQIKELLRSQQEMADRFFTAVENMQDMCRTMMTLVARLLPKGETLPGMNDVDTALKAPGLNNKRLCVSPATPTVPELSPGVPTPTVNKGKEVTMEVDMPSLGSSVPPANVSLAALYGVITRKQAAGSSSTAGGSAGPTATSSLHHGA